MKRRLKRHQRACKRRRLRTEQLEDRRLLAALDFIPTGGTVSEESGNTVVTVAPGQTISVAAQILDAESDVLGFQLNLSASDAALALGNFTNGDFPAVTDNTLDSSADDFLVASGIFTGPLPAPPVRLMGSFEVTAPNTPADYVLSSNVVAGANDDTIVSDNNGAAIAISDFGDLIIRVTDDNSLPSVSVTSSAQDAAEDAGVITVTATLSQASDTDVTVPFTVTGTATDGSDYTISSSPITITAGETTGDISITVIDDSDTESDETVIVTLDTPTGASLGTNTVHTATIEDNDIDTGTGLALDLIPDAASGTVSEEAGLTVITVAPGATVNVAARILESSIDVLGFQLNLAMSDSQLGLGNFVNGDFTTSTDDILDSTADDFFVASGVFPDPLGVPPDRLVGTFDVTAPTAAADYVVTANFTQSANNETIFSDASGNPISVNDFGDLVIRVTVPPPTVAFTTASQSGQEDVGTLTVTAELSAVSDTDVTVPFTATGTATDGSDYTITTSPITIAAGQTSADIVITVTDDSDDEQTETVILTLDTPTGADLGTSTVHTATIEDNDDPTVSLDSGFQTVAEDAGAVTVTASLSAASDTDVTVPFTVTGTATDGSDFTISSSPITIAAGQTSADITISVIDDSEDEPDESVVISLETPTGATLGTTSVHTLTITDNDDPVPPTVTVSTGQTVAEDAGTVSVIATLSAVSDSDVTVPFSVTGTATDGSDFTIDSSPLTIAAGQTTATISVSVTDDSVDEPDETVVVTLGTPTGATLGSNAEHTVTITDNDEPPLPTVTLDAASQDANEDAGNVAITATLSEVSDSDVLVPFVFTGTATDGSDFTISASPLTIAAGQTSATVTISIIDDTEDEPDETVTVALATPTGATLGAISSHTVNIIDNDPPAGTPEVNFDATSQTGSEDAGNLTIGATLSVAPDADLMIPYSVTGTATDGSDYTITPSPITFAAGTTTANITISVIDDLVDEADETVVVTLQSTTGVVLGTSTVHTATITDNDEPPPTPSVNFAAPSGSVAENAGSTAVSLTLSNATDVDVTIPFTVAGTATSGTDFSIASNSITIAAGQTSANINIDVIDDTEAEPSETVEITLGTPTGADLGVSTVHTVTINDNEGLGDNRIIIPQFVARPHLIPGDGRPTAIIFRAKVNTVLTVGKVNTVSVTEQVTLLDQDLDPTGGVGSSGLFTANLNGGELYALIFAGRSEDGIYVVQSSEGFESLLGSNTNLLQPTDVNADGQSTSLDALLVINQIRQQSLLEGEEIESEAGRYYDVNRDGRVSATDVLRIINQMTRESVLAQQPLDDEEPDSEADVATLDGSTVGESVEKITSVDLSQPIAVVDLAAATESGNRVDEVLADESALDELLDSLT